MEIHFFDIHPYLKPYVLMIAYAELSPDEIAQTKFLPDNATSLTLFLNDNPQVTDYFTGQTLNYRIAFAGQHAQSVLYSAQETIRLLNIDFLPWGAYSLFGIPQAQLFNQTVDATELLPRISTYMEAIENQRNDKSACLDLLEQFLLTELEERKQPIDERIKKACQTLTEAKGNIAIKELCQATAMSHSGLTQRFSEVVGVTPKLYGRVARFTAVQHFLGQHPQANWNDIVHQFDYFDQNHFIREFKQFTGAVPKDRRQWDALFDPLKKAVEEGFDRDPEQMQRYREGALFQILHYKPSPNEN